MLSNKSFHNALIICCIRIYFFLTQTNNNISLENLFTIANVDAFDFWKILRNFKNNNKDLPCSIYDFIESLQRKIYRCLAWKKNSQIYKLISNLIEKRKLYEETFSEQSVDY